MTGGLGLKGLADSPEQLVAVGRGVVGAMGVGVGNVGKRGLQRGPRGRGGSVTTRSGERP